MVDGGHQEPPGEELARVAAWCRDGGHEPDHYGEGRLVDALHDRVAELLGMEAALLFPSGTMAQALAMRLWADRSDTRRIGLHPSPPHANLLHLTLPAPPATVRDARDQVAMRRGLWVAGHIAEADEAGCSRTELDVVEGALALTDEAIVAGYRELMELLATEG